MRRLSPWMLLLVAGCAPVQRGGEGGGPTVDRQSLIRAERKAPAASDRLTTGSGSGCKELPAGDGAKLTVIRQMLVGGKPHAAIAYLDAVGIMAPEADLLRADGLRQTGRAEEAAAVYRTLLGGCVAGYAHQGLGLIASADGRNSQAVADLREARQALPADPTIRNDYGYALLVSGEDKAAVHEFLTALELAPTDRRAANNLILLLLRTGEKERAQRFAEQFGVTAADFDKLREVAKLPPRGVAADGGPMLGMSLKLTDRPQAGDGALQNETGAK